MTMTNRERAEKMEAHLVGDGDLDAMDYLEAQLAEAVAEALKDLEDFARGSDMQYREAGFDILESNERGKHKKAREYGIRAEVAAMFLGVIERARATTERGEDAKPPRT